LERAWKDNEMTVVKPYLLDLLANRNISNHIVDVFGITHESPQILLIADGKCIYHNSHNAISYQEIKNNMVL
jgi:bacillithiol system protein YtxJ